TRRTRTLRARRRCSRAASARSCGLVLVAAVRAHGRAANAAQARKKTSRASARAYRRPTWLVIVLAVFVLVLLAGLAAVAVLDRDDRRRAAVDDARRRRRSRRCGRRERRERRRTIGERLPQRRLDPVELPGTSRDRLSADARLRGARRETARAHRRNDAEDRGEPEHDGDAGDMDLLHGNLLCA